jgi:ubiquitin conjugation factor E4 B
VVRAQYNNVKIRLAGLQCVLDDRDFTSSIIQWCQLICAWLLNVATGASPAALELPLPAVAPEAFRMIPQYLVEDVARFLQYMNAYADWSGVNMRSMDDVILCCTALMASPSHVPNPYLRFCMFQVLHRWIPESSTRYRHRRAPLLDLREHASSVLR